MSATRILIYGVTGSGKSTFARRLGEATGIPSHSVDDICWNPDWVPVEADEQRRRMQQICAGDSWILDSAYGQWRDLVLDRAELIIGLDLPRWTSLSRLLRRTVRRAVTREPVCNGNTESLRLSLSSDSILWWHFKSFSRKRARMRAWAQQSDGPAVLLLSSPHDVEHFLSRIS